MKNSKLFIFSCLISTLGSSLTNMALAYKYLLETSQGIEYGLIIYAALLSTVLLAPFIGKKIDRNLRASKLLLPLHCLLALAQIFLAQALSIYYAFILIFITTALEITCRSIIFKILPSVLDDSQLINMNSKLQEILSFGFIFGPLAAPVLKIFFNNDAPLFYIDALTFLIAGVGYYVCLRMVILPVNEIDNVKAKSKKIINVITDYSFSIRNRDIKNFLITFFLHMMAFSPSAYVLALVAKKASNNIEFLYTLPLLSMFVGRIISLRFFKRFYKKENLVNFLVLGLFFSSVTIFPLSFINNIYLICLLEFFLGVSLAIVKVTETTYSQFVCPKDCLARMSSIKQIISIITKSLTIFLVMLMVRYGFEYCITLGISIFFFISALFFALHHPIKISNLSRYKA